MAKATDTEKGGGRAGRVGVLVHMPAEAHRWLKARAAMEGKTIASLMQDAVDAQFRAMGASDREMPKW